MKKNFPVSPVSVVIAAHDVFMIEFQQGKMATSTSGLLWLQAPYCQPQAQPSCHTNAIGYFHGSSSRLTAMYLTVKWEPLFSDKFLCCAVVCQRSVTAASTEWQQWCQGDAAQPCSLCCGQLKIIGIDHGDHNNLRAKLYSPLPLLPCFFAWTLRSRAGSLQDFFLTEALNSGGI